MFAAGNRYLSAPAPVSAPVSAPAPVSATVSVSGRFTERSSSPVTCTETVSGTVTVAGAGAGAGADTDTDTASPLKFHLETTDRSVATKMDQSFLIEETDDNGCKMF